MFFFGFHDKRILKKFTTFISIIAIAASIFIILFNKFNNAKVKKNSSISFIRYHKKCSKILMVGNIKDVSKIYQLSKMLLQNMWILLN